MVRADWSDMGTPIRDDLARFNRRNIPVNLFYGNEGPPIIFPELLTQEDVLSALEKVQ